MTDFAAMADRFVEAQLAGDGETATKLVVDAVARGVAVIDLQARVIRAAQAEIGRLWQANRVTVAQEHLATGISQLAMARLLERAKPTKRNGRVIALACVEGEHHDFPSRLVADFLEHGGYKVRYYGTNLPTDDLVEMLVRNTPDLVALSVTMTFNIGALRDAVARIKARIPALPIMIGGHALAWSPDLASSLGVATAPPDPDELLAEVHRILEVTP